jgi:hypothetical protein
VLLGLLVMMTDPCGYQKCGDPAWLDRAMNLNLWAGGAFPARRGLSLQGGQTAYRLRAEIGVTDVTAVRPRASLVP